MLYVIALINLESLSSSDSESGQEFTLHLDAVIGLNTHL